MGIVKGIFASNISGKVGNVVFRKNGKANVVSQRPANVKNPRSDLQQRQRAFIKSVAAAYSVLRPICDHSFEGVPYGGQSMNYFNKINYSLVSAQERGVLKNSSDVVVDVNFIVSKGSIMWNSDTGVNGQIASLAAYMAANNITNIEELTFAQLLQALNIKKGDQLTVINVSRKGRSYSFGDVTQESSAIYFARYILESDDDDAKAFVKQTGSDTVYILNASILGENTQFNANAVLTCDGKGVITVANIKGSAPNMYTAIVSRKNADKWLRSTAELKSDDSQEDGILAVLPSYYPTDERYLNNAEK